jgi:hypothetical protein
MSTLITAIILLGGAAVICFLFISIEKRRFRKEKTQLLKKFSELGSQYSLSFSSQEVLSKSIIGMDGMNRKLMILQDHENDLFRHTIICLDEVKSCSLKVAETLLDEYGAYELYQNKKLNRIELCFHFYSAKDPVSICFYDEILNDEREEEELGQKAKDWEAILSKMLNPKIRSIA